MGATVEIPDEAFDAAQWEVAKYGLTDSDAYDAGSDSIRAAAPLIVAAELERLAGEYWNRNLVSIADLRHWLERRASELRGEG
jgi:hypothetical protein